MSKALEKAGFEIQSVENISIHYSDDDRSLAPQLAKAPRAGPQGLRRALVPPLAPLPRLVVAHRRAGHGPGFQIVADKNLDTFDRKMFTRGAVSPVRSERDRERAPALNVKGNGTAHAE